MLVMEHGNNLKWLFQVMGPSGASLHGAPPRSLRSSGTGLLVTYGPPPLWNSLPEELCVLQRKCCTLLCYLDSRTAVGVMAQNPSGSLTSLVFPQRKS
jgi:hypothetical protein